VSVVVVNGRNTKVALVREPFFQNHGDAISASLQLLAEIRLDGQAWPNWA